VLPRNNPARKLTFTLSSQFAQHPRHKEDGPSLLFGVGVSPMSPIPKRCNMMS